MSFNQKHPALADLNTKPSTAFSTASSATATSRGTSRSGGSKLLFGEIDMSSTRSADSYASVHSFVLCESSTFLRFWLNDNVRDSLMSNFSKRDLANMRLTCHDFAERAAPLLFSDLAITFRAGTFTKPTRVAALDRLGFHVQHLTFTIPHTEDAELPPLVDPRTGEPLDFTYTPQFEPSTERRPKYGDIETTRLLTCQWPTLFHAATNVPAFIRAFSAFVNLKHLTIGCPGYQHQRRHRKSAVDYALISLRIAVERNCLNVLNKLTLKSVHPGGLLHLSPINGCGTNPRSISRWSRIKHLTIYVQNTSSVPEEELEHCKLLQSYMRAFRNEMRTLEFHWLDQRGPFPLTSGESYTTRFVGASGPLTYHPLHFPKLRRHLFANIYAHASDLRAFYELHKDLSLDDSEYQRIHLSSGTWREVSAPLVRDPPLHSPPPRPRPPSPGWADIPIMLSPTMRVHPTVQQKLPSNVYTGPMEQVVRPPVHTVPMAPVLPPTVYTAPATRTSPLAVTPAPVEQLLPSTVYAPAQKVRRPRSRNAPVEQLLPATVYAAPSKPVTVQAPVYPAPVKRVKFASPQHQQQPENSLMRSASHRLSRWLSTSSASSSSSSSRPGSRGQRATERVREGFNEAEEHLRRVLYEKGFLMGCEWF